MDTNAPLAIRAIDSLFRTTGPGVFRIRSFVPAALFLALFLSCGGSGKKMEREIWRRIQDDGAHLVQAQALYGMVYTTQNKRFISKDFYIRRDSARVFYGYPIKDAKIKVEEGYLRVRLKRPVIVSIDKVTDTSFANNPDYRPTDREGTVDVDREMNRHLQEMISQNQENSLAMTRQISRQYFDALAMHYGLVLDLQFEEEEKAPPLPPKKEEPREEKGKEKKEKIP